MEQFEEGGDGLVVIVGWIFVTLVDLMPQFARLFEFSSGVDWCRDIAPCGRYKKTVQPSLSSLSINQIIVCVGKSSNASQHM